MSSYRLPTELSSNGGSLSLKGRADVGINIFNNFKIYETMKRLSSHQTSSHIGEVVGASAARVTNFSLRIK